MAYIFKTNGTIVEVTPENGSDFSLKELRKHTNSKYVEVVRLPKMPDKIFIIDEEGKIYGKKKNDIATAIMKGQYDFPFDDYLVGDCLMINNTELK